MRDLADALKPERSDPRVPRAGSGSMATGRLLLCMTGESSGAGRALAARAAIAASVDAGDVAWRRQPAGGRAVYSLIDCG
jgi:hypothetical protein